MNANLYLTLVAGFTDHLDKCCLDIAGGRNWTFRDIDALAGALAGRLLARAAPGDRVLVQVEKCPEAVALYLACLRAGLILVPLNTAYTAAERAYFREDAEPAIEIDDAALRTLCESTGEWDSPIAEVAPGDVAAILYTSGTTGRSKGAMLTHANLASNATTLQKIWGFQPDDVLLHALPVYHVHGLFVALNTALLNASTMLFLPRFDARQVMEALPRATVMMGVPTFYSRLLAEPEFEPGQCAHMRLFISGSAPLTEQTFSEFEARTGQRILERYGMSETGMITSNPLEGERLPGTVGYPLPDVTVRVCDATGRALPPGEIGVVEVKGPNVFSGYWRMPEKTAAEFREDGFFITGDLGQLAADGRLTLVGRDKDLIISGGLNVYPREVEECLDALDGVKESAVIGVPHPDFGEAVVAVCVPSADNLPDNAQLEARLAWRLARFKQPKRYIQVASLPRNSMGKVQKNRLREQYRELFQA
jgi:malonyl-CoA/methylmalonyl-CoA synthetase